MTEMLYSRILLPIIILFTTISICRCKAQPANNPSTLLDSAIKVSPESLHFTVHVVESHPDGSKAEIDTLTGYRKYYFPNGILQMEGKVTKSISKDYRDGIWKYYNDIGELTSQETYDINGKVNQLSFMYFNNGVPISETYQFFEGDYKDKASFKFHKIERLFSYKNGQIIAERYWINDILVEDKAWDNNGKSKAAEPLKTAPIYQKRNGN